MKFEFSIHVEGSKFDPDRFNDALADSAKGVVRTFRQVKSDTSHPTRKYWQSKIVPVVSGSTDELVLELLNLLTPALLKVKGTYDVRISATVAGYYNDVDSLSGFFLSAETIGLLAGIGASLDTDIVPSRDLIERAVGPTEGGGKH